MIPEGPLNTGRTKIPNTKPTRKPSRLWRRNTDAHLSGFKPTWAIATTSNKSIATWRTRILARIPLLRIHNPRKHPALFFIIPADRIHIGPMNPPNTRITRMPSKPSPINTGAHPNGSSKIWDRPTILPKFIRILASGWLRELQTKKRILAQSPAHRYALRGEKTEFSALELF